MPSARSSKPVTRCTVAVYSDRHPWQTHEIRSSAESRSRRHVLSYLPWVWARPAHVIRCGGDRRPFRDGLKDSFLERLRAPGRHRLVLTLRPPLPLHPPPSSALNCGRGKPTVRHAPRRSRCPDTWRPASVHQSRPLRQTADHIDLSLRLGVAWQRTRERRLAVGGLGGRQVEWRHFVVPRARRSLERGLRSRHVLDDADQRPRDCLGRSRSTRLSERPTT
jgi:hypothetical protein